MTNMTGTTLKTESNSDFRSILFRTYLILAFPWYLCMQLATDANETNRKAHHTALNIEGLF